MTGGPGAGATTGGPGAGATTGGPGIVGRPLAPQQRGLWFLQQLRPSTSEYNVQIALRLRGPLRIGCLHNALTLLIQRHEPLRTRIRADAAGQPRQYVSPAAAVELVPESAREPVEEILRQEVARPFDLAAEPPMRVRLAAFGTDDHLLVMTFNHLAVDGESLGILARELTTAYAALAAGEPVQLPPLPLSYSDFAAWEAERGTDETGLAYWRRELDGVGDVRLPADHPGHGVGATMTTLRREVAPETVAGLSQLARQSRTSLFSTALTCYALLLHRTTGQRDFAIGMPVSGRVHAECEPLVGCFLNTVCVRVRIDPEEPVRDVVRRTAGSLAGALQHQAVPFADVVRAVRADRSNARHPLFSAFCSVLDAGPPPFAMAGVETEIVVADYPVARFDLNATFALGLEPPAVQAEFSDGLFETATSLRLADRLIRILDWVAADPEQPVARLPLVGRTERGEVLALLNGSNHA